MILFLGLFSWIALGLIVGLLAARLLPGRPSLGLGSSVLLAIGAAIGGGLLSTTLGFGGLATYDPRALVVALLTSILALTLRRIANLAP